MKRFYTTPEEEIILFSEGMTFFTEDSCDSYVCHCVVLVCQPEDVIAKVTQPSESSSKKQSDGPKNKVGFDMTFDR